MSSGHKHKHEKHTHRHKLKELMLLSSSSVKLANFLHLHSLLLLLCKHFANFKAQVSSKYLHFARSRLASNRLAQQVYLVLTQKVTVLLRITFFFRFAGKIFQAADTQVPAARLCCVCHSSCLLCNAEEVEGAKV